ncbi:DUF58 domain-containing protein [Paenibacillus sp. y28]|uniref:DUF58 domain-containing protein n=1 Tax=Paenibacillus sp. y28 TaxID=3129110 RepID=UPI00301943C8
MRGWWAWLFMFILWIGAVALLLGGGKEAAVFLAALLGLLLVMTLAGSWGALRSLEIVPQLSQAKLFAGDTLQVKLTIRHRSPLPLCWLVVREYWVRTGSSGAGEGTVQEAGPPYAEMYRERLLFPWFRRCFTIAYPVTALPRGRYCALRLEALTGDVFGLTEKRRHCEAAIHLTVYPRPLELGRRTLRLEAGLPAAEGGRISGEGAVQLQAASPSPVVSGIREYRRGDAIRRIHWKLAARDGELRTKTGDSAPDPPWLVFLDASGSSYSTPRAYALFESCVAAAAGLLREAQAQDIPAGLRCGCPASQELGLASKVDLRRGYELLADVRPDGRLPFAAEVSEVMAALPAQVLAVCVTPALDSALAETLGRLRAAGRPAALVWVTDRKETDALARQLLEQLARMGCFIRVCPVGIPAANQGKGVAVDVTA